ncbi:aromatic ring-hydroxylating oxygenase subunit alpha [Rhodococcus jostii]|uniref:Phenylpropionate dioxygenase, large terminal subunit n=1 Tax=Rhodococcus jostii TaxID=132919 RepID=A0A1H4IM83_RHOJO|nr:Phenylpropionate dioxygenase, large terminal subunit [Rhodococcus jostii]
MFDHLTEPKSGPRIQTSPATVELFRTVDQELRQGIVSPEVFSDPELYALELDRIFARCWCFVAHESEIPMPGDYVLRYIGQDQFIVVRDEDCQVRVLFNNCTHRGSPVCRVEKGNSSHFRCPYHSWLFKNNGEWSGAPHRKKAYKKLDSAKWGLASAPHVDSVHGLIFASLDPEAPTLDEYLGGMRWYLDALLGLNEQGMRAIGEPHRWRVPANWKSGAENFMADAYHVPSLHRSAEEVGMFPGIEAGGAGPQASSRHVYFDEGHGMIINDGFLPPPWHRSGFPPEVADTFQLDRLSPDQRQFVENHSATTFLIFPNLGLVRVPASPHPDAPPTVFTYLRQWQPHGPSTIVNWNWTLGWNSASEQFNEDAYVAALSMHGPAGILEQDDTVVWGGAPVAGRSSFARKSGMRFNFQLGLDGMSDYAEDPEWRFPGRATTTALGEAPQRAFYRRWLREVSTPDSVGRTETEQ